MHPVARIARQVVGWLCIFLGVVGLVIPLFPQLPFLAVGALLLAPYVRVFRRFSAWIHKKYPRFRGPLRRFRDIKQRRHAAPSSSPEVNPPPTGK
jgi:uncharacterized membrane protein YbaN (DUF454 family)